MSAKRMMEQTIQETHEELLAARSGSFDDNSTPRSMLEGGRRDDFADADADRIMRVSSEIQYQITLHVSSHKPMHAVAIQGPPPPPPNTQIEA